MKKLMMLVGLVVVCTAHAAVVADANADLKAAIGTSDLEKVKQAIGHGAHLSTEMVFYADNVLQNAATFVQELGSSAFAQKAREQLQSAEDVARYLHDYWYQHSPH